MSAEHLAVEIITVFYEHGCAGLTGFNWPAACWCPGQASRPCRGVSPPTPRVRHSHRAQASSLDTAHDREGEDRDRARARHPRHLCSLFLVTRGFTVLNPSSPSQGSSRGQGLVRSAPPRFPRTWMGSGPQRKLKICSINGWMDERMDGWSEWMDGRVSGWMMGG